MAEASLSASAGSAPRRAPQAQVSPATPAVFLPVGAWVTTKKNIGARQCGTVPRSIARFCTHGSRCGGSGSVRRISRNCIDSGHPVEPGQPSPDSKEEVPMSHATQLHDRGYLTDSMQIMN